MRFFIFLFTCLMTVFPTYGQSLHFVSIAWVSHGKQALYDQFNEKIAPIWTRRGIEVLLRAKVIGTLTDDNRPDLPTEIAVLRIASRQQFQDYIADPDYQAIRSQRTGSIDKMIVLEGTAHSDDTASLLPTAPQFAVLFGPSSPSETAPALELSTSLVGSIKGPIPAHFSHPMPVNLFALS